MDDTPIKDYTMDDMLVRVEEVKEFIGKRDALNSSKLLQEQWPLADYHMMNFDRKQDRTTQLFREALKGGHEDTCFYVVLHRLVNSWPALCEIDYSQPFTPEFVTQYTRYIDAVASSGTILSKTSYITYAYANSGERMRNNILLPMLAGRKFYRGILEKGQGEDVVNHLKAFTGMGNMMAIEIAKDMMLLRDEDESFDVAWRSFYSVQTLNYLAGRSFTSSMPKKIHVAELERLVFLLDMPMPIYSMGRVAHLFAKMVLSTAPCIRYIPKRALVERVSSFEDYLDITIQGV